MLSTVNFNIFFHFKSLFYIYRQDDHKL